MVFLNQRGLYLPKPIVEDGFLLVIIAFVVGIILTVFMKRHFKKKHDETGVYTRTIGYSTLLVVGLPAIFFLLLGSPLHFDFAVLGKFNLKGGMQIVPEFIALTFALSVYTATYIAEAIRSGIEAVDKGQKEAAAAIGLTQTQSLKLIVQKSYLNINKIIIKKVQKFF